LLFFFRGFVPAAEESDDDVSSTQVPLVPPVAALRQSRSAKPQ
jgi:hypothetical protein